MSGAIYGIRPMEFFPVLPAAMPSRRSMQHHPMAKIPDKQGVFFELDGVLVQTPDWNASGEIEFLPGSLEALGRLDPRRFRLFVATSRHDIAFGQRRERDFTTFCEKLLQRLQQENIPITKIYSCPYHPKGKGRFRRESVFRKPGPGIFKMAQQEFDLNLHRCWMIGHTTADILAGQRADVGTILVRTGFGGSDAEYNIDPNFVEDDFFHAIARVNQFEHALRV
jgi:D-glycero-D-manno-heptose 1,7-bisphosphate phosphatase